MTDQGTKKPLFTPLEGENWRAPQLVRDKSTMLSRTYERSCIAPDEMMMPLLLGKLHGEIHVVSVDPYNADGYADVHDVLRALASRCGQDWNLVLQHSQQQIDLRAFGNYLTPEPDPSLIDEHMDFSMDRHEAKQELVLLLHEFAEVLAEDLGDIGSHVRILSVLRTLADLYSISFQRILAVSEAVSARYGGYSVGSFEWETNDAY